MMKESIKEYAMSKKEVTDNMEQNNARNKNDLASDSRRRLLKLGAYVPPAIIGMAIISNMPGEVLAKSGESKSGGGAAMSCNPNACNPCLGDKDGKQTNKDKKECLKAQKKRK
jgi:uncharacterized protein (DUF2345 family)